MSSPFPGMDPYLEDPEVWTGFHTRLAGTLSEVLLPLLSPDYWVDIERRVVLCRNRGTPRGWIRPDVAVALTGVSKRAGSGAESPLAGPVAVEAPPIEEPFEEPYLVIVRRGNRREVVTVIEIASPTNKTVTGREEYLDKRNQVLRSRTNLVEIDLLRGGERAPIIGTFPSTHYRALVFRGDERPRGWGYGWNVTDSIPEIAVPLLPGDPEVALSIQEAVRLAYERGGYARELDYSLDPVPPFDGEQAHAVADRLRRAGLRP